MMRGGVNRKLIIALESILKYPNSQIFRGQGGFALFHNKRNYPLMYCIA